MRELSPKEKDLLDRVIKKPDLQPFFFRKLKGLHWYNALSDSGFFAPEKNPKPVPAKEEGFVSILNWPAIEYLVTTSEELSIPDNKEYAIKVIELIRKVTEYAKHEGFSNYRTWWQLAKVIRNIPAPLLLPEDIDLLDYWLDDPFERGLIIEEIGNKWLPELLAKKDEHSQKIALRLLSCIYRLVFIDKKANPPERIKPVLRYNPYYGEKLAKKEVVKLSGKQLGLPAVELFQERLVSLLDVSDNDSWSSIWRKAIEDHEQNGSLNDADDLIVAAYRDCILGYVEQHIQTAKDYVQSLFKYKYQTIKRVAIYVTDKRFEDLKDLADSIVTPEFFHDNYRHEQWHFFNGHYKDLTSEQQKKVIEIIQGLEVIGDDNIINDKATAYKRAIWLSAIKHYDDNVANIYKTYIAKTGTEPDHPDFSSYMTVGRVDHKSPIPIEKMLSLDVDSLVKTINSYEDTGRGWFGEPGLEGLVKTFKDVVKTKAKDIYIELKKFGDSDLAYIHPIIEAYRELWNENKELPWNDVWPNLLDFCWQLINRDNFWSDLTTKESSHFVANRNWIVGTIGQLIEDGVKSDDHAFDASLQEQARNIIAILLERQSGSEFKPESDAVFVAINSPRGRCLEALINLTLRSCRLEHNKLNTHTHAWELYSDIYETELARSNRGEYEFITLVAMFLANFDYMSREWVKSHLSDIFDQSNYQKWLCAMQGYIHVGTVYEMFYKHLKINGDFLKALDDGHLKKQVNERIIQSIAIAYINNFEDVKQPDSLIAILIQRRNTDELRQLVWFVWTLRDKRNEKLRGKVYELWPRLLEITDLNSKGGRILASSLCHWAAFVDKIDSTVETWLLKIALYADENHNASNLLQSLAEISDTQPIEAQKVWVKMLESYSYDYPEEAFRRIFKNLIALGTDGERKAKEVVDAYIRHGIDRPRTWLAEIKAANGTRSI